MAFPLKVHGAESTQQALYELVDRADPAIHGSPESDCAEVVSSDKQSAVKVGDGGTFHILRAEVLKPLCESTLSSNSVTAFQIGPE